MKRKQKKETIQKLLITEELIMFSILNIISKNIIYD